MRFRYLVFVPTMLALTACNSAKKPSDTNFRIAINQYLVTHGRACVWIGQAFPVDVSELDQKSQSGTGPEMAALEAVGLVRSSDTVVVTPGVFGPGTPHRVKRYEPTTEGRRYFQQVSAMLGQSAGFCYGDKTVDTILKWTEPASAGSYSRTEVTYTYKMANLAPWAQRSDVQRKFGDVRATVNGISKSNEVIDLQLTNRGWEVPAS